MNSVQLTTVSIPVGGVTLDAYITVPDNPKGVVLFSHGSGSSRQSPRNRFVAEVLNEKGMATLLADLLTEEEDSFYETRFDIKLLTERLVGITRWAIEQPMLEGLGMGYFGASTGAASALRAAAFLKDGIQAVVSRGGRPDLAEDALPSVNAPTLLIVGSLDGPVIEMNRAAYKAMHCQKKLEIVEGATHLFEEPGKLDEVARLATQWFERYLVKKPEPAL
ncbi:MAG: dienelactone hydrolase family protein [Saprospiraceae bacterium]|nr:dienelactone hydrolase family protein [Saprospiraceae bacterium]